MPKEVRLVTGVRYRTGATSRQLHGEEILTRTIVEQVSSDEADPRNKVVDGKRKYTIVKGVLDAADPREGHYSSLMRSRGSLA